MTVSHGRKTIGALALLMVVGVAVPQADGRSRKPRFSGKAVIVADAATGEVLFRHGTNGVRAIASISKLMALRVVLKAGLNLRASTKMVKSDWTYTKGGARTRLIRGRTYVNRDLVHAALLGSDNRAVMALGRAVGLKRRALVAAMNAEAKALGLQSTRFVDATGIDHGNRSTPSELVRLLQLSSKHGALAAITREGAWLTSARERGGQPLMYRNTNLLLLDDDRPVRVG
ncbi:MAG: D-alanyl-D-alanine endopeptidase (penicillin-binding protein 7), partial [Myxococcota bacterium]